MTRSCSSWWRWKCASSSPPTTSPATTSRSPRAAALAAVRRQERPRSARTPCMALMKTVDDYIPQPERPNRQAVPDAGGGRVLHLRPRHGRHRPDRARGSSRSARKSRSSASAPSRRPPARASRCSASCLDQGDGRRQRWHPAARHQAQRTSSAARCLCKPGSITPAHQVHGRGLYPDQGGGRGAIPPSSPTTVPSSTSGPPT